jgi:cytochrome c oxidase subunit 2
VRVLMTGDDVIHSWSVPAFGLKTDTIPGRLNETWFKAEREGIYYGQCSQLCGQGHGFMPIAVKVVSPAEFQTWLAGAQKQYGAAEQPAATSVAQR